MTIAWLPDPNVGDIVESDGGAQWQWDGSKWVPLPGQGGGLDEDAVNQLIADALQQGDFATQTDIAGMATQSWVNQQLAQLPAGATTLQVSFVIAGKPAAGQNYNLVVTVPMSIQSFATDAQAYVGTAASAGGQYMMLYKVAVGGAVTTLGSFNMMYPSFADNSMPATFAVGDVLRLTANTPQDATFADIGISILATRT